MHQRIRSSALAHSDMILLIINVESLNVEINTIVSVVKLYMHIQYTTTFFMIGRFIIVCARLYNGKT